MKSLLASSLLCLFFLPCKGQEEMPKNTAISGVTFSLPWLNYYRYINYHENSAGRKFGFFGIGISGYYKKDEQKFSVSAAFTEDLTSPVAAINYSKADIRTSISSSFFELTYHRPLFNDFYFIGGFNFTNYNFRLASTLDSVSSYKNTDQTIGISVGTEYRFNNYYSLAAVYRPALASFETDEMYRHLINIELRIDFDFKKRRK